MRTLASFVQCMRKNVTFKKVYRNYLHPMVAISWPSDITAHHIFIPKYPTNRFFPKVSLRSDDRTRKRMRPPLILFNWMFNYPSASLSMITCSRSCRLRFGKKVAPKVWHFLRQFVDKRHVLRKIEIGWYRFNVGILFSRFHTYFVIFCS